jgi:uncharacterized protein (UPF0276 family)
MTAWECIARMCERTGCGLLLDVNDVYVSAASHGFDPFAWLDGIPAGHVRQIHLAGHSRGDTLLGDTHDQPVPDGVWSRRRTGHRAGGRPAGRLDRQRTAHARERTTATLK